MKVADIFGLIYAVYFIALALMITLGELKVVTRFQPISAMFRRALAHRTGRLVLWLLWAWWGYHLLVALIPRQDF